MTVDGGATMTQTYFTLGPVTPLLAAGGFGSGGSIQPRGASYSRPRAALTS